MSSVDGVSVVSEGPTLKKYRYKTSFLLLTSSYLGLLGLITIIISFSSPYWLSSHKYTYSSFVRLGLWTFCFDHYKHPPYQYDETFTGCRWIYDPRYHNIRDWLQPGWFIFVQTTVTLSMLFSLIALMIISLPIMHFYLRYNVIFISLACVFKIFSAISGILGWLIFAIKHDIRSWLMNPRFNHLDWSFYLCILSTLLNSITAILFAMEAKRARAKRQRFTNLVYNMHPSSPNNGFETIPLKTPPVHQQQQPPPRPSSLSIVGSNTPQSQSNPGGGGHSHGRHSGGGANTGNGARSPDSIQSSPYASISRFSQGQQQISPHHHGYQMKQHQQQQQQQPPISPRHFTAV